MICSIVGQVMEHRQDSCIYLWNDKLIGTNAGKCRQQCQNVFGRQHTGRMEIESFSTAVSGKTICGHCDNEGKTHLYTHSEHTQEATNVESALL